MTTSVQRDQFARAIADYCVQGFTDEYEVPEEIIVAYRDGVMDAIRLLTTDIGAAQEFCYVIGLKVDLYNTASRGQ